MDFNFGLDFGHIPSFFAASGEKLNLTTFTSQPFVGAQPADWTTPELAELSDNSYAIITLIGVGVYSRYIQGIGLNKVIPPSATIDGVEVFVEKKSGAAGIQDKVISLVKGGVVQGNNKADTVTNWPASDTIITYGGSADLWGLALTPADVNAANFGAVLSANTSAAIGVPLVDHIQIAVHYS